MAACLMEEVCWEYLDPKGHTRGPFASKTMVAWYDNGMLPEELRVRHEKNMEFMPIREMFPKPIPPFRTKPAPKKKEPPPAPAPAPQAGPCHCHWVYVDVKKNVQGPFTSAQMSLWYEHKMLPKELSLRRTTDTNFATIAEFFPKPAEPFKTQPQTPLSHRLLNAATAQQRQVGLQDSSNSESAKAAAAPQPAAPESQPPQAQPKAGKAKAKGREPKNGKQGQQEQEGEEKGTGKGGKEGKGGAKAKAKAQQSKDSWWSSSEWNNGSGNDNKNWWEWNGNGWEGWSGDGWEDGYSKNKQGAEWKGDGSGNGSKEKNEKASASQQQANGFGLKWGPKMDVVDLFPEAQTKRVLDEGIVWEEKWVSPLAVRFSQGKIHPFFHERGPISEVLLQIHSTPDAAGKRCYIEPPFPPMRLLHLKNFGCLATLDNRRLYALQRYALQEWPKVCVVKALCVEELTPTRLKAENRKFTNRTSGLEIEIESRSNAFDTFSWVTEAGRIEHTRFCRPIAFKAVDKAMSLLPVLLVHAMLHPKILAVLRARWPLLQYLATNLKVSQRREFPARRLMLNHVLEVARPTRNTKDCPQVCMSYELETLVTLSKGKSCLKTNHTLKRPLKLNDSPLTTTPLQQKVLSALVPFFCLPYAQTVLRGTTQDWVVGFLLAWGKVAIHSLPDIPYVRGS